VIVVDEDVNIHDAREVEWAVVTRAQPDRDFVIIAGAQGSKLDPSSDDGVSAKLGIDATVRLSAPAGRFTRIHVPGEEMVDLAAVIDTSPGNDWRRAAR
jgi:2,5-furandicarboxylate decarboxylase 1